MKHPTLIFVLYDSIKNSVFSGQVLQPLLKRQQKNPEQKIVLISFEKEKLSKQTVEQYIPSDKHIEVIILKKIPFFGPLTLWPSLYQLKTTLRNKKHYQLIARGPLAGWLSLNAINKNKCVSFIVQARGLLAEEYRYVKKGTKNRIKHFLYKWRTHMFKKIEKNVYGQKSITIEAVSLALKTYIIENFGSTSSQIKIAQTDIPESCSPTQVSFWRKETRNKLQIANDAVVYCFNGSAKPWQCPEKVVHFFAQQLKQKSNNFLLLLTQDKKPFKDLLTAQKIPNTTYHLITVEHHDIYRYLAAADVGLMFREATIINWVSRPTKVLEYQAVGLKVIHNNTVEWLTSNRPE